MRSLTMCLRHLKRISKTWKKRKRPLKRKWMERSLLRRVVRRKRMKKRKRAKKLRLLRMMKKRSLRKCPRMRRRQMMLPRMARKRQRVKKLLKRPRLLKKIKKAKKRPRTKPWKKMERKMKRLMVKSPQMRKRMKLLTKRKMRKKSLLIFSLPGKCLSLPKLSTPSNLRLLRMPTSLIYWKDFAPPCWLLVRCASRTRITSKLLRISKNVSRKKRLCPRMPESLLKPIINLELLKVSMLNMMKLLKVSRVPLRLSKRGSPTWRRSRLRRQKKEVTELKALVPEIEEKIKDTQDMKKEAETKKEEGAASSGDAFGSSKVAEVKPVSSIADKRKAEDEESSNKKIAADKETAAAS